MCMIYCSIFIEFTASVRSAEPVVPTAIAVAPDIHTPNDIELVLIQPVIAGYVRLNQDYPPEDPYQDQDGALILHHDLQSANQRHRLDQAIKISGISSSIEMIFGIVICAYYGPPAFFLLGSIIDCSFRVVVASDVLYTYSNHPALRRSSASMIASLCILSFLDIIYTWLFYNSFEDITTSGIAACLKYPFTLPGGAPSYAGDSLYFNNAQQCASATGKLFWKCYCYNNEDHNCYSFDASQSDLSDATAACGSYIHQTQSVLSSALSITILIVSVFHCIWYVSAISLVKQLFR